MRQRGPWDTAQTAAFLDGALIPLRLSVVTGSGWPAVASLWFLPRDGALWCATTADSHVARTLRDNPRCAFEVAPERPPYHGVRGQALAEVLPDGKPLLAELLDRYGARAGHPFPEWLLARDVEEVRLRLVPQRLTAWDYRTRMAGAFPD